MLTQVLVVTEDPALRQQVLAGLEHSHRFAAAVVGSLSADLDGLIGTAQLLVVEYSSREPARSMDLIRRWRERNSGKPIVMVAASTFELGAIDAMRCGASDYLKCPLSSREFVDSLDRVCPPEAHETQVSLIGQSATIRELRETIRKVACSSANVLITGETGTGKELAAQAIHLQGNRSARPFICVNCAAIPDSLLESELFGYEKGAFTGANTARDGKVKLAEGGTLFLDEIGEMSLFGQAKILRMIETGEIWPLGARNSSHVDARIVAATNRDLEPLARSNAFRTDLFFRLNVARIRMTPLRERAADIPALLDHFARQFNTRFGYGLECFADETLRALLRYDWPGNVRELKNVVEFAFVNTPTMRIALEALPRNIQEFSPETAGGERALLLETLCATNWNVSQAARKLHWSRMTIYRKMAKYEMVKGPAAKPATAG